MISTKGDNIKTVKVSVIIPVYNEGQTIDKIILNIKSLYPDFEIIIINDGSLDHTASAAKEAGTIVYNHPYNIGNGAAVKSGLRIANGEILVLMDGDGQHNPEDISKMLKYLPEYDMVVGARSLKQHASIGRAFGNKIYNWFASYVTRKSVKDLTSGFRIVKSKVANEFINLLPNTYSYPTTITLCVLKSGRSIKYVPIDVIPRKSGKSKVKGFEDSIRFFMIILKICTLYSPLKIFLPVSISFFIIGLSYYLYTFINWGRFTNMSALLFTTSVIIFLIGLVSEQISQILFVKTAKK